MRVFFFNSYLTWENGRHGVCLFRILHAQPESAFEHEITLSFGIVFKTITWGPYLHLSSPGDLLHISLLHWASEKCKGGPLATTHPQASHPGEELTCTASVVLLGSSQSPFAHPLTSGFDTHLLPLDQVRQTDYISYIINPSQGPLLPATPQSWWRSSFSYLDVQSGSLIRLA